MPIYTPYTYIIGWSTENKWYYGVRYAKRDKCLYETGCHPDEFWLTYFTSSEIVNNFREEFGDPDIKQIRKTFCEEEDAIKWERKVLYKMDVIHDKKWLNESNGSAIRTSGIKNKGKLFWNNGIRNIRSDAWPGEGWVSGMFLTEDQRKQKSEGVKGSKNPFYGKKHTDENKKISSERMSGDNHPFYDKKRPEHSEKMKDIMKGKKKSQEHRNNISKSHNVVYICPHCGKKGGRMMLRWHFDKCKHKSDIVLPS